MAARLVRRAGESAKARAKAAERRMATVDERVGGSRSDEVPDGLSEGRRLPTVE